MDRITINRTKNKFLFIDEWWKLAFNPIAADKSLEISKIARAYGCSMVLATQQMSDILAVEDGKYGNAVLNNCATKILMSMKEKDVYSVSEMVGLTDSECNKILRFKAGQGLLIAGDNRMTLQFNPSETEKLLTFTDNETLMRYAQLKKQEELAEHMKKAFKNAKPISDAFETTNAAKTKLQTEQVITASELKSRLESEPFIKRNPEGRNS